MTSYDFTCTFPIYPNSGVILILDLDQTPEGLHLTSYPTFAVETTCPGIKHSKYSPYNATSNAETTQTHAQTSAQQVAIFQEKQLIMNIPTTNTIDTSYSPKGTYISTLQRQLGSTEKLRGEVQGDNTHIWKIGETECITSYYYRGGDNW